MNSDSFKNVIYLLRNLVYKWDLALNNPEVLIDHKAQSSKYAQLGRAKNKDSEVVSQAIKKSDK